VVAPQRQSNAVAMPNQFARGMQLVRVPIGEDVTCDDVRPTIRH
jgi:hypothetical protein